jgi:hypothetical protein
MFNEEDKNISYIKQNLLDNLSSSILKNDFESAA